MKKRRKLSVAGMIIIGIAFIVVVFLLVLLMKYFFLDRNKTEYKDKNDKNPIVDNNTNKEIEDEEIDYGIDLKSYKYFISPLTDFNFVIAEIDLNNLSISYSLEDFETEEGIYLSDTAEYISKLKNNGIYPSILNVVTAIDEKNGQGSYNFFIPIKNKQAKKIELIYKEQKIEIDLTKNIGDIETLVYNKDSEITDDQTFKMKINNVENLTGIYLEKNGEPYEIGSQMQLYGLICDIECLTKEPFLIESAYFEDSNGYVYTALFEDVKAFDVDNLVGLRILKASTGALLFEIFNPTEGQSTLYYGKLHIKLNNDVNEYIINVSLN